MKYYFKEHFLNERNEQINILKLIFIILGGGRRGKGERWKWLNISVPDKSTNGLLLDNDLNLLLIIVKSKKTVRE